MAWPTFRAGLYRPTAEPISEGLELHHVVYSMERAQPEVRQIGRFDLPRGTEVGALALMPGSAPVAAFVDQGLGVVVVWRAGFAPQCSYAAVAAAAQGEAAEVTAPGSTLRAVSFVQLEGAEPTALHVARDPTGRPERARATGGADEPIGDSERGPETASPPFVLLAGCSSGALVHVSSKELRQQEAARGEMVSVSFPPFPPAEARRAVMLPGRVESIVPLNAKGPRQLFAAAAGPAVAIVGLGGGGSGGSRRKASP